MDCLPTGTSGLFESSGSQETDAGVRVFMTMPGTMPNDPGALRERADRYDGLAVEPAVRASICNQ
jgi:hypothetical protein